MKTKKYFFLLLCMTFILEYTQAQPIRITPVSSGFQIQFTLPNYELRDTILPDFFIANESFKYIKLDDFGMIADEGYPELPQYSFDLQLAPNAIAFSVVESQITLQSISLDKRILPNQKDIMEIESDTELISLNTSYYASSGGLYNFKYHLSDPYIVFGQKGLTFSIFPFIYNPQAGTLQVVQSITFTLICSTQLPGGIGSVSQPALANREPEEPSAARDEYLNSFFSNYASHPLSFSTPDRFYGRYLMITDPSLEQTLNDFADYKRSLGYIVNVYNTNQTGRTVSQIKDFIQNQYNNPSSRPEFVLLVGSNAMIPAYQQDFTSENMPHPTSDRPYACVAGNDPVADVFLGRFPANNSTDLSNMIRKTVYMEMNLPHLPKKAKFIAGDEWDVNSIKRFFMLRSFKNGHDYVVKNMFDGLGFLSEKLYQPSQSDVTNAINDNPLFFIYSGHGFVDNLPINNNFSITSDFFNSALNNTYPFTFAFACQAGNFVNIYNFGANFLKNPKGGVIFFGSSVNSRTNSDNLIEKQILGKAFSERERIGEIINLGMQRYQNNIFNLFSTRRANAYNLLGDPSLNRHGFRFSDISGANTLNNCSENYTISNIPASAYDAYWTATPGIEIVQDRGLNGCTAKRSNYYTGGSTATITLNYKLCGASIRLNKTINLGENPSVSINQSGDMGLPGESANPTYYTGRSYFFEASEVPGSSFSNYQWELSDPILNRQTFYGQSTRFTPVIFRNSGGYTLDLYVQDNCGWRFAKSESFWVQTGGPIFLTYPNPVVGNLNIEVQEEDSQGVSSMRTLNIAKTYSIRLTNSQNGHGVLERNISSSDSKFSLNLSNIPNGLYILHIIKANEIIHTETIAIEKP